MAAATLLPPNLAFQLLARVGVHHLLALPLQLVRLFDHPRVSERMLAGPNSPEADVLRQMPGMREYLSF